VAVNPVTNKIYVANDDSTTVTVIDGATNSTTTVSAGTTPCRGGEPGDEQDLRCQPKQQQRDGIHRQQVQAIPLTTVITRSPPIRPRFSTPSFTFTAQSTFSPNAAPAAHVYFKWTLGRALGQTLRRRPSFTGTVAALAAGLPHYLRICGRRPEADSEQRGSPLIGGIAAYGFLVLPGPGLSVTKDAYQQFHARTNGATYTVTVANAGYGPTSGLVMSPTRFLRD